MTGDGVMPFSRYIVRKRGRVEVGSGSCVMCHARVMPDGTLLKGAQGNFPADRIVGYNLRQQAAAAKDPAALLEGIRAGQRTFFSMPWLTPDPIARVASMSIEDIASVYETVPTGASTRVNLSLFTPAQIPDLIGLRERRFLDHTGLVRQRSIGDVMRYVAIVQGERIRSLRRFPARRSGARSGEDGTLQRRSVVCAGKISVFAAAAGKSEPGDDGGRARPRRVHARRVQRLPHRAALHQQQANAAVGFAVLAKI